MWTLRGRDVVTLLKWTPIFEWYMVSLVVKRKHQKDKCHYGIKLTHNTNINLGPST